MKLVSLGTRGGIKARSPKHYQNASLLIEKGHDRIMIDCGTDWLSHHSLLRPTAIPITDGHVDHVEGLKRGAPCPVYATDETFLLIKRYQINDKRTILPDIPFNVGEVECTPFALEHSLRVAAVGYRITAGGP